MTYRYLQTRRKRSRWPLLLMVIVVAAFLTLLLKQAHSAEACNKPVYLTFDTGNMQEAELIATTLRKYRVKATFFVANEKTFRGDAALDPSWSGYWKSLANDGHAFGSHTWRHGKLLSDLPRGAVRYRPQFGDAAGQTITLSPPQFCAEVQGSATALQSMIGKPVDALWRAPGGRISPHAEAAAQACGYSHVRWAEAGFLGDELPSDRYPNEALLAHALQNVKGGDVLMAHLGIWSRKEPFAPMFDPLIAALQQRGFCFRTLREHPQYSAKHPPLELAAEQRTHDQ